MNVRVFAALFVVLFLIAAGPMLLVQPSGLASAGLAAGFSQPMEDIFHVLILAAIGLTAAWLGEEAIIVLPLSTLLMLAIGAMLHIEDESLRGLQNFIVGAILLFAMSMSLLRQKILVLSIAPVALWAYFEGRDSMQNLPLITMPLYFMIGSFISAALIMAIGVSLGVTLTEAVHKSMDKLKNMPAVSTFLSFF